MTTDEQTLMNEIAEAVLAGSPMLEIDGIAERLRALRAKADVRDDNSKCEPPAHFGGHRFHWLTRGDEVEPVEWNSSAWRVIGGLSAYSPEEMAGTGWQWHSVAEPAR